MLGAIAGDIIGSVYERPWDNIKTTEFPLFQASSRFTDDTVLTVATADVLLHGGYFAGAYKDCNLEGNQQRKSASDTKKGPRSRRR